MVNLHRLPRTILLGLSVFLVAFFLTSSIMGVFGFESPTANPPLDNVHTPVNVSENTQYKIGELGVARLLDTNDNSYYVNPGGPDSKLSGNLNIQDGDVQLGATSIKDGTGSSPTTPEKISTNLNADLLDGYNANDLLSAASAGSGAMFTAWGYCSDSICSVGEGSPACPAGWTEAYAGFGPFVETTVYKQSPSTIPGFAAVGSLSVEVCASSKKIVGYIRQEINGNSSNTPNTYSAGGVTGGGSEMYSTCRVCVK
ncbi:MAG: hypothetical protein A2666_00430 [Parcubacteria group bacterium RIFCSPHIGHO2_01_FULL_47_10b]|nr:MAG: hypothetical protein A2666_00430 [Parcubacteria group bacterium RIFCSPHIGHO2_01_FULL_47_10b]